MEFNNPQAVGAAWSRTIQKPSAIFINDGPRIRPGITSADPDAFVAELIALSARIGGVVALSRVVLAPYPRALSKQFFIDDTSMDRWIDPPARLPATATATATAPTFGDFHFLTDPSIGRIPRIGSV